MGGIEKLEFQIELQRSKMYQAFKERVSFEEVIKISQDLDHLLNKLEKIKNHEGVR